MNVEHKKLRMLKVAVTGSRLLDQLKIVSPLNPKQAPLTKLRIANENPFAILIVMCQSCDIQQNNNE